MKTNLSLIVLCLLALVSTTACGQKVKRPESYNYQRGCEAARNRKWEEAVSYLNKDLQENPHNGYSFSWVAYVRLNTRELGPALSAAESALKYLPKKDVEYLAATHSTRGDVHLQLGDTAKALADFTRAIQLQPEQTDMYDKRAQLYFELRQYDLSDADYHRMVELDPGLTKGYMGMGRNANAQEHWQEGLCLFDYAAKLESDLSVAYAYRAESYLGLEKWDEATDDIITALEYAWDDKAADLTANLKEPALTLFITKLKVKAAKAPNKAEWPFIIGLMYKTNKHFEEAVDFFNKANVIDEDPTFHNCLAECYYAMGRFRQAIRELDLSLNMDSTQTDCLRTRADFYYEAGDMAAALAAYDQVITSYSDYAFAYYRRGWFRELSDDFDGAVDDLSMSIVLDPEYSYAYASRADVYAKQGKVTLAEADYRKVIELENTPEKYACAQFAYHGLGQDDKALAVMQQILENDSTYAGHFYDASCLYGRMGNTEKSLEFFEKALQKGFRRFAHIATDDDMDLIRHTEEFRQLIERYDTPSADEYDTEGDSTSVTGFQGTTEIPFTKEGGVCTVKCRINGLPLHFVFDTGASIVSLSMVEATFMMKNGYLNAGDVVGSQHFMDANGNVSVGTVINLKKVAFGDSELTNVRASVVRNQKAPLLLGQSVLGRMGKIEIDNQARVIRISH